MKAFNHSPSWFLGVFRFSEVKQAISWLVLLAFLPLATGCNYYRLKQEKELSAEKVASLPNYKRFILHQGTNAWELTGLTVQENTLTGKVKSVPEDLLSFVNVKPNSSIRYKNQSKGVALHVVHLHVNEMALANEQVVIPVSSLKRIDIADKDTGATVASYVLGGIGGLAVAFALVAVIATLLKSSCPFVYVKNGNSYQFVGETYGGAIFSPLERDDYMPLPLSAAQESKVQVKITNELKERQYTNLAQLLVVQHAPHVKVLLDQQGKAHALQEILPPVSAVATGGADFTPELQAQDSAVWSASNHQVNLNSLVLRFPKPAGAKEAKLVLHAQNTLWMDYLYGEFTKQFGGIYNRWAEKQKDVPAAELYRWQQEQGIPLLVEVNTPTGWQVVEKIPPVGPLAGRDLVIPLPAHHAQEQVQVRLSCGFMFWQIDQAGMDFTSLLPLEVQKIAAASAFEGSGQNMRPLLVATDQVYLRQFNVGDAVELTFALPQKPKDQVQTAFLHTRGYYEHIREYTGLPNLVSLRAFEKPGHFIEFSRQKYVQFAQENNYQSFMTAHAQ
ncbi:hypothetical protein ACD591_08465 [Rufibacter glacialis]|uniref:Uncharacterized protein n=1 Tax=Rufibacter glacialis TaxID=1259555 RepID=A0A5M8QCI1_9BACT|nr:hypothetical protein [Rufibacter glacialis]KAA6432526.1 hypothetical protein FOE74_15640 [Rufibacter glacialis]GGK79468.1 hypothetical protein GCM10011405_29130 [Rufibacter glacialis]